ncbi:MAG: hypothetical protein H6996_06985 [Moraxellaceae bacterium]|nr:hypothetical protein [Moraxellaceae bacterium]
MAEFNRNHLIVGALGFVLGSVVTTASITAVLMTQSKEKKVCPPVVETMPQSTTPDTVTPIAPEPEPNPTPVTPSPAPTPSPEPIAKAIAKPAPVTAPPPPKINTANIKGIAGEQAEQLSEEQKQLLARKQNLQSQLQDSEEIIRLKEQQIKEMEAKLKAQP